MIRNTMLRYGRRSNRTRDIVGFVVLALTATLLWVDSTVAREVRADVQVECEDTSGMASLPVLNPWIGNL